MICDNCKRNEATYHKVTNINGDITEEYLCSECASKRHSNKINLFNFKDMFGGLLNSFEHDNGLFCNKCLSSYENFLDTGLFGCSDCYSAYKNQVSKMLEDMQGATKHTGKQIDNSCYISKEEKLANLQSQLKKAVEEERFEDAIVIKKQITDLKEEE